MGRTQVVWIAATEIHRSIPPRPAAAVGALLAQLQGRVNRRGHFVAAAPDAVNPKRADSYQDPGNIPH
jgi:hypothetical protein